jgi:hypothetical protein
MLRRRNRFPDVENITVSIFRVIECGGYLEALMKILQGAGHCR